MEEITIYKPRQRSEQSWIKSWIVMFKETYKARELIYQLYKRDFLMMYRKSFFGWGWILVAPIFGIVSWVFMNAAGVLTPGEMSIPYPAFVLVSTTLWGFFTKSVISTSQTLKVGASFIQQVNFPHYSLLFKQLLQELTNFLLSFIVITVVLLLFQVEIKLTYLLFPVLILPLIFFSSAIGILVSVIASVTMDIEKIVAMFLNILMFVTPVIYTSDNVKGEIAHLLLKYNPLTYLFGAARDILLFGTTTELKPFLLLSASTFLLFLVAIRWFYVSEEKVIEKMV